MKKIVTMILFIGLIGGCSNKSLDSNQQDRPKFKIEGEIANSPKITPFYDQYWLLLEDLTFSFHRKNSNMFHQITVPAGFVTDLASIPVGVNIIFNHYERYATAGIIHDYLYWIQPCRRKFADRIYRESLKAYGVPVKDRYVMWAGLKAGGSKAWNSNQKARESGETRFIPEAFRSQIAPRIKWHEFRKKHVFTQVEWEKVVDNPVTPSYCNIADEE